MGAFFQMAVIEALKRVEQSLGCILEELKEIKMTQAELAQGLKDLQTQVAKISTESSTTLQKVTDLEAALENVTTTPDVDAAFAALKAQVQKVDDLIPDAPTP